MSTTTNTAVNVTPDAPVFIGCSKPLESDVQLSYFFNGCFIYSYNHTTGHCTCLTELDVATATVKSFGVVDKRFRSIAQAKKARTALPNMDAANDNKVDERVEWPTVENLSPVKALALIEHWFSQNFDVKREAYRESPEFYNLIQHYLALCCDAYKEKPEQVFLDAGIQVYLSMAQYSWLNPCILHNAACVYWLAGEQSSALNCIELALDFRYTAMESLLNDEDLKGLKAHPRFRSVSAKYQTLKPKFNYVTPELFEAFESFAVQQSDSFVRFMRGHLLKNFRFYDISELSARMDSSKNDNEREYWERLASFNNNYLYNYMLMDEPLDLLTEDGNTYYQLFQQYRHYRVLNPLVFAKVSELLFHHAHYWGSQNHGFFNQRDSALLQQSFQLFQEFYVATESLCSEKRNELMAKAKEYDIFNYMEKLGSC